MQNLPLSKRLYEETKSAHEQVESMAFVVALRDLKLSQNEYIQYLADLKYIYATLEEGMRSNLNTPAIKILYDDKLCRKKNLEADLQSFQALGCPPSNAAQDYVKHLNNLSKHSPILLIAHAYVRYMGDLSGGRMIKKFVEQLFPGDHTDFYNFDEELLGPNAIGAKFVEYKNVWKGRLDGLNFTDHEQQSLIEEAKKGFEYAGRMFVVYKTISSRPSTTNNRIYRK